MIVIPIHPNIMKYVVSDYLLYDDLKECKKYVSYLKLNSYRIKELKYDEACDTKKYRSMFIHSDEIANIVEKKIDDKLFFRKIFYKNILVSESNFDIDEKLDGICHQWHPYGRKWSEITYKNGKLHGLCKIWENTYYMESYYKDGKLHGTRTVYENEVKIGVQIYENGRYIKTEHINYLYLFD